MEYGTAFAIKWKVRKSNSSKTSIAIPRHKIICNKTLDFNFSLLHTLYSIPVIFFNMLEVRLKYPHYNAGVVEIEGYLRDRRE